MIFWKYLVIICTLQGLVEGRQGYDSLSEDNGVDVDSSAQEEEDFYNEVNTKVDVEVEEVNNKVSNEVDDDQSEEIDNEEHEMNLIKDAIGKATIDSLHYLIQVETSDENLTRYFYPGDISGLKLAFVRPSLDGKLDLIIFPAPEAAYIDDPEDVGFGNLFTSEVNSYIILKKNPIEKFKYFFLLAYAWTDSEETRIEWDSFDESQIGQTKLEREVCQGKICQLAEYIFGTCLFRSRVCTENKFVKKDREFMSDNEYEDRRRKRSSRPKRSLEFTGSLPGGLPSSYDLLMINFFSPQYSDPLIRFKKSSAETMSDHLKHLNMNENDRRRRRRRKRELLIHERTLIDHFPIDMDIIDDLPNSIPCVSCKRLGHFYDRLEEKAGLSILIARELVREWENESFKPNETDLEKRKLLISVNPDDGKIPYIGYGTCHNIIETLTKPKYSKTVEEFVQYYSATIKVQCDERIVDEIRSFLTPGGIKQIFEVDANFTGFKLPHEESQLLDTDILTPGNFQLILNALIFYEFVATYEAHDYGQISLNLKDRLLKPISKEIEFLSKLVLQLVDFSRTFVPKHFVKVTKTLARLLKHKFYSFLLNRLDLQISSAVNETERNRLFDLNFNDLGELMGLKEWLIFGMSDEKTFAEPFVSFIRPNEERVNYLVNIYLQAMDTMVEKFVDVHPGGNKILLGAGSTLENFWVEYPVHQKAEVYEILEKYRIGNLAKTDWVDLSEIEDPFAGDPVRNPNFSIVVEKPYSGEPPANLLTEFITPNDLVYVCNHFPVPNLHAKSYKLIVEGEKLLEPKIFTLDEIKSFPKFEITATIQCGGNRRANMGFPHHKPVHGINWDGGAIGNVIWGGVKLRDVLKSRDFLLDNYMDEIEKYHVQFYGHDNYSSSLPLRFLLDGNYEPILAYEMNKGPLPPDHGFPLRVFLPGIIGGRSCKWLKRIAICDCEVSSLYQQIDFKTFNPSIGMDHPVDTSVVIPMFNCTINSFICSHKDGDLVTRGQTVIKGWAFAGGGRQILRVEVSKDQGANWIDANLTPNLKEQSPEKKFAKNWTWVLWECPFDLDQEGQVEITVKAVDSDYNQQPEKFENIWNFRGLVANAYHKVKIVVQDHDK